MKQIQDSYLSTTNIGFIEAQLQSYLEDPASVSQDWQQYFAELNITSSDKIDYQIIEAYFRQIMTTQHNIGSCDSNLQDKEIIRAFRLYGHYYANLDLLGIQDRKPDFITELTPYIAKNLDIVKKYSAIYCNNVGFECSYLDNLEEKSWLEQKIENEYISFSLSQAEQKQSLQKLVEAEGFEQFLNNRFVGAKRFSLEGCDSFIPLLDYAINLSPKHNIDNLVLGMAHRGRLNTLVNILGKKPQDLFDEFEGTYKVKNNGDVKYHKGGYVKYSTISGKTVDIYMLNNPSHLEAVNPVAQGVARAMQDQHDKDRKNIMPILIHGDSALIGLGVNQGCFNMSQTNAYNVQGTIHIVLNNQIGFTNSKKQDNRSSVYCTDIAKMVQCPIIHVNADDIRSILFVTKLAIEYRQTFSKDIVIDLVGFRKYGHNEADDPTLTQPFMYSKIKQHKGVCELYAQQLIDSSMVSNNDFEQMKSSYLDGLKNGKHISESKMQKIVHKTDVKKHPSAKIDKILLKSLHDKLANPTLPAEFVLHTTVAKLLQTRQLMVAGEQDINVALAETLAYAVLLKQGTNIRISGEDVGRGTFTHRQAVLHNFKSDKEHMDDVVIPLQSIAENSQFMIYDSVLNEEAVLSFEYGYSLESINNLVIWEAQFGDFANGAQVVIDQFITSAESKWDDKSRLLMLLPHGLDGQGPEHSSARIERFLQLAAQDNIVLLYPTTASQMFYMMLEQVYNSDRLKPTVVFLSKRLLRAKESAVNINDLIKQKSFEKIIDDASADKKKIKKIVCCIGQVYYDLMKMKQENKYDTIAIVRLEQIYPFPLKELKDIIADYSNAKEFLWVQEEHYNQGAWSGVRDYLSQCAKFECISRVPSATTACGTIQTSNAQLKDLLECVFK